MSYPAIIRQARKDPLGLARRLTGKYGDIVHYRIGQFSGYLLNHPDHFHHVLSRNHRNYNKENYNYKKLKTVLGEGLITAGEDEWAYYRNLFQPFFRHSNLMKYSGNTVRSTEKMLCRWQMLAETNNPVELSEEMANLTLKIITASFFNLNSELFAAECRAAFKALNSELAHRFKVSLNLPVWVPTARNRKFLKSRNILFSMVLRFIVQRQNNDNKYNDLLDTLLAERSKAEKRPPHTETIRDHILTFLLAGHETTAGLLTWTCYLLAQNPRVIQKLRSELFRTLGNRLPDFSNCSGLNYCTNVLQESLRLYPPVWIISRRAVHDDTLADYRIPAGSTVTLCSYLLHRHPDYWEDPDKFNPDRFAESRKHQIPASAFYPFGGGPRSCIGSQFALMEARVILAMIISKFDLHLVPGHPVETEPLITLQPRYGLKLHLTPAEV
jgi:cytochrome P450